MSEERQEKKTEQKPEQGNANTPLEQTTTSAGQATEQPASPESVPLPAEPAAKADIIRFPQSPRRIWTFHWRELLNRWKTSWNFAAKKGQKPRSSAERPPDTPPRELAARYTKGLRSLRLRTGLVFTLAAFLLYLTLQEADVLPHLSLLGDAVRQAWIASAALLLALGLAWDVLWSGLRALRQRRPNVQTLSTFACLAVLADSLTLLLAELRVQTLPFFAPAALALAFHLWGMARLQALRRLSCRTAAASAQPYVVARDGEQRNGTDLFAKYTVPPVGFGSQMQEADGAEQRLCRWAPLLFWGCFILSMLATVAHHQPQLFFWSLSATYSAAAALGGTLCFALPCYTLTKQLAKDGAALAGWAGLETAGKDSSLVLTDIDLFSPAAVSIRDMEMFQGYSEETVLSVTATLLHTAGCGGLDRLFQKLVQEWDGVELQAEQFQFHETGLSAMIQGAHVLVGNLEFLTLYGIAMPYSVPTTGMVFCAIDGALAGLFSLNYALHRAVAPSLQMLEANAIRPVLATRDFNLAPAFLRKRFHLPVGKLTYPTVEERVARSDPERPHEERLLAVLCREGIAPFATLVVSAPRVAHAVRMSARVTLAGSFIGMLLTFYLSSVAALSALTALSMTICLLLWFLPLALLSGWVKQF